MDGDAMEAGTLGRAFDRMKMARRSTARLAIMIAISATIRQSRSGPRAGWFDKDTFVTGGAAKSDVPVAFGNGGALLYGEPAPWLGMSRSTCKGP